LNIEQLTYFTFYCDGNISKGGELVMDGQRKNWNQLQMQCDATNKADPQMPMQGNM